MRKNRRIILIVLFTLVISSLTFASERDIVKTQGLVMAVYLSKNLMIVNERRYVWDQKTVFFNDKGSAITVDKLQTKAWVYIEGEEDRINKRVWAKKIYLLPKYINEKEKHLYPFME